VTTIIDNLLSLWNNPDGEIPKELQKESQSPPDNISSTPSTFLKDFNDPSLRKNYDTSKEIITGLFHHEPFKFIGYLEESDKLWGDVKNASNETGIDANLLYSIGMKEGFAHDRLWHLKGAPKGLKAIAGGEYEEPGYDKISSIDTFNEMGLDIFFDEQESLLEKGYLKSKINSIAPPLGASSGKLTAGAWSEDGKERTIGRVSREDGWRATGALIKQNEEWMFNTFKNRGLDFNALSPPEKRFWIYASFNAGPGAAADVLKHYGSMENVINDLRGRHPFSRANDFSIWMRDVLGVVGSVELLKSYNPFDYKQK